MHESGPTQPEHDAQHRPEVVQRLESQARGAKFGKLARFEVAQKCRGAARRKRDQGDLAGAQILAPPSAHRDWLDWPYPSVEGRQPCRHELRAPRGLVMSYFHFLSPKLAAMLARGADGPTAEKRACARTLPRAKNRRRAVFRRYVLLGGERQRQAQLATASPPGRPAI